MKNSNDILDALFPLFGFLVIYFGALMLGLIITIIKAIAIYFFDYQIIIFGTPL